MREEYIAPEMEVVEFDCEDVITTSGEDALPGDNFNTNQLSGGGW